MISQVNGIATKCNMCIKTGPVIRYDYNRYHHGGEAPNNMVGGADQDYINQIHAIAIKEALNEGFIQLPGPDPARATHICPECIAGLKVALQKKK